MRFSWVVRMAVVALVSKPGAVSAQSGAIDAVRRPTFALVSDPAGEPIAGATVTFAGCLPHLGTTVGPLDVQVVQADARGRAQAKLQAGLCYVAWAIGPADAAGSGQRSEVHGYFAAGGLLELVCTGRYTPRVVAVTGVEAWRESGPLRYFVVTASPGTETEVELRDGALTLPPSPSGPDPMLEVRTAEGQALWGASATIGTLAVPPPQRLRVRVGDENGAPLAGARLHQRTGRRSVWRSDGFGGASEERTRDLGSTGADGTAEVVVCYPADPLLQQQHGELLVFASAKGRSPVAGGIFNKAFYVDDRKVGKPPESVLPFTCRRVDPLTGNCGRVPAGTVAHLFTVCKLFSGPNSYTHDARVFVTPIAADGTFVFDDVPAELHCCRLTLVMADGSTSALPLFPAVAGRELPPEVVVRAGGATLPPIDPVDFELHVTDPTGGPARGAVAYVMPQRMAGVLLRDAIVRLPLDARGAVSLRLVPGSWLLLVVTNVGYAATAVELAAGPRRHDLAMQPLATMRVRLRDRDGAPIPGAQPHLGGTSTESSGDPVQNLLSQSLASTRSLWARLRTDADGRLAIPFVPVAGMKRRLALHWEGGASDEFELAADEGAGGDGFEVRPK